MEEPAAKPIQPRRMRRTSLGPSDSDATTILVLGILGLVFCGILGPVAWFKGTQYLRLCRMVKAEPRGTAKAGWILGIVGTILLALGVMAFGALLLLGFLTGNVAFRF